MIIETKTFKSINLFIAPQHLNTKVNENTETVNELKKNVLTHR